MTNAELVRASQLADELIAKLERIKALWAELPSEDDLSDIAKTAGGIVASLESVVETMANDSFPSEDDLQSIATEAGHIDSCLTSAMETFNDDSFPSEDDLASIAEAAGRIATNLESAKD